MEGLGLAFWGVGVGIEGLGRVGLGCTASLNPKFTKP